MISSGSVHDNHIGSSEHNLRWLQSERLDLLTKYNLFYNNAITIVLWLKDHPYMVVESPFQMDVQIPEC